MFRIRRFGVIKTATTVAVLYAIAILIVAVPVILFITAAGRAGGLAGQAIDTGPVLMVAVVGAGVYAVIAWIGTAIACALYNLAARVTGGIEVEVESVAPPPPAALWGAAAAPGQQPGT